MKLAILSLHRNWQAAGERLCRLLRQATRGRRQFHQAGADLPLLDGSLVYRCRRSHLHRGGGHRGSGHRPHLKSKPPTPPSLCVDELGAVCHPSLSGHIGGANSLGPPDRGPFGATAVITTATDLHGLFAVDTWAKSQGLALPAMLRPSNGSPAATGWGNRPGIQ